MATWGPTALAEGARENANSLGYTAGTTVLRMNSNTSASNRTCSLARFTNVTIAQGSTINSATFSLSPGANNDANGALHCEDIDDCPDLATLADVFDTRVPRATAASTAYVEEDVPNPDTVDITSAVQEVIDRPGWSSGNALGVLLIGNSDITKSLYLSGGAPTLTIDYTAGGAGASIAVLSHHHRRLLNPT